MALPILSVGTHTFVVSACNGVGCTAAPAFDYVVSAPPPKTCTDPYTLLVYPLNATDIRPRVKVTSRVSGTADYQQMIANGWTYLRGYRVTANLYDLTFICS